MHKDKAEKGYMLSMGGGHSEEKATEIETPEHVQKLASGGYACMHCGGDTDEMGLSMGGEFGQSEEEEEAGEDGGATEQSGDVERQRMAAMYGQAMGRR